MSYLKENPTKKTFYEVGGLINYGYRRKQASFSGFYSQLFDRVYYSKLDITGGSTVHQVWRRLSHKKKSSTPSALPGLEKTMQNFTTKIFIRVQYEQEVYNGIFTRADIEYCKSYTFV
ncbi:hypothetical protein QW060_19555 [Myroides ceti]|uniref:Uncharacterized protein n=1 Tax=Paenimyroides ceti TaxID=395087 RepID=A0ABT8CZY6_9FLAO|nr:hypothetical protein [Paenimyroides ceti]MDN3709223.1 hypothetical protein [Paenimyroides ceti]